MALHSGRFNNRRGSVILIRKIVVNSFIVHFLETQFLTMRVSEIRVKRISVNQGLGVGDKWKKIIYFGKNS